MTFHSSVLNFDSEVHLFDCWQSIMSQVDDLDGPQGLEAVENVQTLDTTRPDDVRAFVLHHYLYPFSKVKTIECTLSTEKVDP